MIEKEYFLDKHGVSSTLAYKTWKGIISRTLDKNLKEKYPTYKDCTICEEWKIFSNFEKWFNENYYTIPNEKMDLDKDILIKGNKLYSPNTCCFVPHCINTLFVKTDKLRGNLPIGVSICKKRYQAIMKVGNRKHKTFGCYDTKEEAFIVYKYNKEKRIKEFANKYKEYLPNNVYEALYNYQVEITD